MHMTAPGEAPKKNSLPMVIAGVGGCLGLLVIVVLVGAIVVMLRRPHVDGGGGGQAGAADTVDWVVTANGDSFPVIEVPGESSAASNLVTMSGRVVDADTGAPIGDAEVLFMGADAPDITYTESDGTYRTRLERGHSYIVSVSATGYLTGLFPAGFDLDENTPAQSHLEDIELQRE